MSVEELISRHSDTCREDLNDLIRLIRGLARTSGYEDGFSNGYDDGFADGYSESMGRQRDTP